MNGGVYILAKSFKCTRKALAKGLEHYTAHQQAVYIYISDIWKRNGHIEHSMTLTLSCPLAETLNSECCTADIRKHR